MRRSACFFLIVVLALIIWPSAPTTALAAPDAPSPDAFAHYAQTGHNVGPGVKPFYDANGGPDVFGFPLTEVVTDPSGMRVQYFERARFELRSDVPGGVQLTPAGRMVAQGRTDWAFAPLVAAQKPDVTFFPESQHEMGGAFAWFWQSHGGLAVFGYPISEEFAEKSTVDGQDYLVQYFERARFEYHADHPNSPYDVVLSGLGSVLLSQRADAAAISAPATPIVLLGKATTGFKTSINEREHNIARATVMFNGLTVPRGQEFSFLSVSDFSESAGFVEGYGIVGDRLERVMAGGLCQVSTTLFRAVSNAGLQITDRTGHSHIVNFYENILGFDATVDSPTLDFRFRNDSPGDLYISTKADTQAATVTFWIWGVSDGRTVSYRGPVATNWTNPGPAQWAYDPNMRPGTVQQLVHGRRGATVNYYRTVLRANGTVLRNDNYYTLYTPWADMYAYGRGGH